MRQFTLINANGETYNITEVKKSFFHSVKGLGFGEENTYQRVGNRFVMLSNRKKQGEITGQLRFWNPNAQAEYENFVKFTQILPIQIAYTPINKTYYARGTITEVSYEEKEALTVSVKFKQTTPFFEKVNVVTYPTDENHVGKIYNYEYPYVYSSSVSNTVVINMDTSEESPCRLSIYGAVQNPTWKHYVNNVLVATGGITGNIPSGNRLVIDTTGDTFSMLQLDPLNNIVADMYQASDFGTERAIYLQRGQNRITIEDDGSNKVTVVAEAEIYHASV